MARNATLYQNHSLQHYYGSWQSSRLRGPRPYNPYNRSQKVPGDKIRSIIDMRICVTEGSRTGFLCSENSFGPCEKKSVYRLALSSHEDRLDLPRKWAYENEVLLCHLRSGKCDFYFPVLG